MCKQFISPGIISLLWNMPKEIKKHILLPTVDRFNDKCTYPSGKSSMLQWCKDSSITKSQKCWNRQWSRIKNIGTNYFHPSTNRLQMTRKYQTWDETRTTRTGKQSLHHSIDHVAMKNFSSYLNQVHKGKYTRILNCKMLSNG